MKQLLKSLLISAITIAFLILLSTQFGQIPPIGKFFDPMTGFWHVAWQADVPSHQKITIQGLTADVKIIFDRRGVPHIFGASELDVYTAIGYIHARDRLWQLDIQYRFSAGRVAEAIGKSALNLDIDQRKMGLAITAQQILANLDTTMIEYQVIKGYTRGVNQFIDQLTSRDYPFEFKLLNYQPEPWTVAKTILVNVSMGYLSRSMDDLYFNRLQQLFSQSELEELYPVFAPTPYPIIPDAEKQPMAGTFSYSTQMDEPILVTEQFPASPIAERSKESFGSNNWVVSGSKTRTGKPILANDPHLSLDLPSVWYEAHLNCPEFDVYGVTLLGAPFVIIGFNRHIAWGMTNCGWDVTDLFREKFDTESHDHYLFNDNWKPVRKIHQVIHVKNAPDTSIILEYTHRGPVIERGGEFFSMKWTGSDTSFAGISVYWLNRAKNYDDYRKALARYTCPAQNFIYADVEGNIAMTAAGSNPVRRTGMGRSVSDGSTDKNEWTGYTPFHELPSSFNPIQGYLASTNQQPLNAPFPYFGWSWPSDYRARRINMLLKENNDIDVEDMMKFQTDAYAVRAQVFVPFIIQAFENYPGLSENAAIDSMMFYLKNWNYEMRKNEVAATIFDRFMINFKETTWKDHFPDGRFYFPDESVLESLTKTMPLSKWFDAVNTKEIENRDDMIGKSLAETRDQLLAEFGSTVSDWKWERYHRTKIPHLSRLAPMGIDPFPNNGGFGTLNVGHGRINSFGPSWRMIVSLENPIRAWGVYPGGQSGNPASAHYLDFLETYKNERYFELLFPVKPSDLTDEMVESTMTIMPGDRK